MMRYLLQTEDGIDKEPLRKGWALVPRASYEVLKRQKVPPPPLIPLLHVA